MTVGELKPYPRKRWPSVREQLVTSRARLAASVIPASMMTKADRNHPVPDAFLAHRDEGGSRANPPSRPYCIHRSGLVSHVADFSGPIVCFIFVAYSGPDSASRTWTQTFVPLSVGLIDTLTDVRFQPEDVSYA